MDKNEVLAVTTFGHRVAEDEADTLSSYFVETDQWRKVFLGQVDIVYGPKGSGKSALYSLLRSRGDELRERGIIGVAAERITGAPVFEALVADPPTSEESFRGLWKLYFLSLIGTVFRDLGIKNEHVQRLMPALEAAGLVLPEFSLKRSLRAAMDYIRRIDSVSGGLKIDPTTGLPGGVEGKVTLREPGNEERKQGYASGDTLLEIADAALGAVNDKIWIVLDRLDVAFAESAGLEENALRALFRVYRDIAGLANISLKIFLRDDIWARLTSKGFREASHITKSITITWDYRSLLNLVVRRALYNEAIREFYEIDPTVVLASAEEQEHFFYRMPVPSRLG